MVNEIRMTIQEYLSKIGAPIGMTVEMVDRSCRDKLKNGDDLTIFGPAPKNDKYIISNESIREYYAIRDRPASQPAAPTPKVAPEFTDNFELSQPEKKTRGGK